MKNQTKSTQMFSPFETCSSARHGARKAEPKMESELTCPVCNKAFVSPIILPCSHNVCLSCSQSSLTTAGGDLPATTGGVESDDYVTLYESNHLYQSIGNLPCLKCPICKKLFPLDSRGVNGFPRNRLLENIVNRYYAKSNGIVYCQLCEENQPAQASVMCEQCEVAYCDRCCKTCHPSRGPLAKHSLIPPSSSKSPSKPPSVVKCSSHMEENISMYCVFCRIPVCYVCLERGKHSGHEVKALGAMFKEQKGELSANMNILDGKNIELKSFIQQLHGNCSIVQENGLEFEASVVAQCDALISFIQQRKIELLDAITAEMTSKIKQVKEQIKNCEKKVESVAGLLQYANECLQETDAASFLLVANCLNGRIVSVVNHWSSDVKLEPLSGVELELTLDTSAARQALHDLHFIELKAPVAPEIVPDECTVTNNAITLSWKPRNQSCVDGYVVEVDDGTSSGREEHFLEVYRGNSLECTVSGLQFNSTYRARVKGFNKAGEGDPSDEVYLTTSDVAWFALDPLTAHPDMVLTNDNTTSTCTSFDDRVVLGNIGFSRGCHYWEVTIDRYDGNPDPAVGVALGSTIKDSILGKDDKAWCMYIDSSRSWFRHNNEHSNRRDGGVEVGSVIGVLLDIAKRRVSFYLNDQKRGIMRLPDIPEAFYAAFSLNRNVQITLHTGLDSPDEAIYNTSLSGK